MSKEYIINKIDSDVCDRRCVISFLAGAVFAVAVSMVVVSAPEPRIQSAAPGLEHELQRCIQVVQDLQKSTDFWRDQALSMKGTIDHPERKIPETRP